MLVLFTSFCQFPDNFINYKSQTTEEAKTFTLHNNLVLTYEWLIGIATYSKLLKWNAYFPQRIE